MTTTEYKHIICNNYCKSRNNRGICAHCVLNPILNNNFELSDTAKHLIKANILHCGSRLIDEFVNELGKELCEKFGAVVNSDGR